VSSRAAGCLIRPNCQGFRPKPRRFPENRSNCTVKN
jgi:hypothetical protein